MTSQCAEVYRTSSFFPRVLPTTSKQVVFQLPSCSCSTSGRRKQRGGRVGSMLCSENGLLVGDRNMGQQPTLVAYNLDLRETGQVEVNIATDFLPREPSITDNHVYMTVNVPYPLTKRFPLARATRDLSVSETALGQTSYPEGQRRSCWPRGRMASTSSRC